MPMISAAQRRAWALALAVLLLDQFSKAWVVAAGPAGVGQTLLPGLVRRDLVYNTGAAFSLFSNNAQLLGVVSLLVAAALVVWIQRSPRARFWQTLAMGLVLGGAAGNGLDRWRLGAVIDWLALVPITFPVFNLADVAINAAIVCFALDLLADGPRHP
jgi:signal peptidase II